jgi:hypothetical protein
MAKGITNSNAASDRTSVIQAVKTPLSFLVLGFLIIDGTIGALAISLPDYRTPLIWTVIISVPSLVVLVAAMAIWRPESLAGARPLDKIYGRQFASDLYIALDGSLRNLAPDERAEAWIAVADVITTDTMSDAPYRRFCTEVAAHLTKVANLPSGPRSHGPSRQSR